MSLESPENVQCWVCDIIVPRTFAQAHHIRPQATGQTDSTVYLCSRCHDAIHKISVMFLSNQIARAQASAVRIFRNNDHQNKALKLASEAAYWLQRKKNGELGPVDGSVTLTLSYKERLALQTVSRDNNMSMSDYARSLLASHLRTKLPKLFNL